MRLISRRNIEEYLLPGYALVDNSSYELGKKVFLWIKDWAAVIYACFISFVVAPLSRK